MEKKIAELKQYLTKVKDGDHTLQIMEIFLAIITGILIKNAYSDISEANNLAQYHVSKTFYAVVSAAFYVGMLSVRLGKAKYYPSTITEDIESTGKLKAVQSDKYRIEQITGYVDTAISDLNNNTCNNSIYYDNSLCDQDLEIGITKVLHSVIKRPDIFLNCICTKFSVFANISCPYKTETGSASWKQRTFNLRDEFQMQEVFENSVSMAEKSEQGAMYTLYKTSKESSDQMSMCTNQFKHNGQDLKLITVSIPNVCETGSTGVLYLIYEGDEKNLPVDFEQYLKIFCRITTNWIAKYSECISTRYMFKTNQEKIETLQNQLVEVNKDSHIRTIHMIKMFNRFKIESHPDEVIDTFSYNSERPEESEFIWNKKPAN